MFFKTSIVLLAVWLLGVLGPVDAGDFVHLLLLVGLMLGMVGFLKAHDEAPRR